MSETVAGATISDAGRGKHTERERLREGERGREIEKRDAAERERESSTLR